MYFFFRFVTCQSVAYCHTHVRDMSVQPSFSLLSMDPLLYLMPS